jgi:hypothetical protein
VLALAVCAYLWLRADGGAAARMDETVQRLHPHQNALLAVLIAGSAAASLAIDHAVLGGLPHTQDEVAYLFQARTYASGRLCWSPPASGLVPAFQTVFLVAEGERLYGKYPFGWPALLACGALIGLESLVNPALNAIVLLLFHRLLARHMSWRAALAGTALLASSPFFVLMGSSYMSHPASLAMFLLLLSAYESLAARLRSGEARGAASDALIGGTAVAALLTIRPLDAVVLAVPLYVHLACLVWRASCGAGSDTGSGERSLRSRAVPDERSLRSRALRSRALRSRARGILAGLVMPPLVALALVCAYNHTLTGNALLPPFLKHNPADRPGFGPGVGTFAPEGHNAFKGVLNATFNMLALNEDLFGWPSLGLLPVVLGLLLPAAWTGIERVLIACAAGIYLLYFTFMGHGLAFGPRYYHVLLPVYVWFALRGLAELVRRTGTGARAAMPIAVAFLTVVSLASYWPARLQFLVDYWDVLSRPSALLASVPADAGVIVVPDVKVGRVRDLFDSFFSLNSLNAADPAGGRRVFVRDGPWVRDGRLQRAFPGRRVAAIPAEAAPTASPASPGLPAAGAR